MKTHGYVIEGKQTANITIVIVVCSIYHTMIQTSKHNTLRAGHIQTSLVSCVLLFVAGATGGDKGQMVCAWW